MDSPRSWTFCSLVGAFLDLTLAYFLLCGATFAFFVAKFLRLFGLHLPRSGFHRLLLDLPPQRISSVMNALQKSFPFESIHSGSEFANELQIAENSNSRDLPRQQLRCRRSASEREQLSSVFSSGSKLSFSAESYHTPREQMETEIYDDVNSPISRDGKSFEVICGRDGRLSLSESSLEDRDYEIRVLKEALERERASLSLLYLELEKERSAAASAADEAMAMIVRLQKEKAGIEMESRQYQRMVNEKNAYDEEEMGIMKEIMFMREMENHVLLRENELYRQILLSGERIEQKKIDEIQLIASSFEEGKNLKPVEERESDCTETVERVVCDVGLGKEERESDPNRRENVHGRVSLEAVDHERTIIEAEVEERENHCTETVERVICDDGLEKEERESVTKRREDLHRRVPLHPVESVNSLRRSTPAVDQKRVILEAEVEERENHCLETVERMSCDDGLEKEERESVPIRRENVSRRVLHPVDTSSDLRRNSASAVDQKRLTLEAEVEFLRERLKLIQRGRESLNFSLDYSEKENFQLQLLEEVASQLREIRRLTEPRKATWQSLETRKQRCQSVPSGLHRKT